MKLSSILSVGTTSDQEDLLDSDALASSLVSLDAKPEQPELIARLRASNIFDCCVRQKVFMVQNEILDAQYHGFAMRLTLAIGKGTHWWLQNDPELFGDRRYGIWKCTACGFRGWGGAASLSKGCPKCKAISDVFVYDEMELVSSDGLIGGHPDCFLLKRNSVVRLTEFKTINGNDFETLRNPLISHVWQVNAYFMMLAEGDKLPSQVSIDPNKAYLIYFSKKHEVSRFPVKAFLVRPDLGIQQRITEKKEAFRLGLSGKKTPELHRDCAMHGFGTSRAKKCPVRDLCKEIDK